MNIFLGKQKEIKPSHNFHPAYPTLNMLAPPNAECFYGLLFMM